MDPFRVLLFLCLSMCLYGEEPEGPSGIHPQQTVVASHSMVATANSHASRAGLEILEKGGNAIDALIAIQCVLNVVEPQSSGIGGGAFLLYFNKATGQVKAYDGRETAPQGVHEKWFLDLDDKPFPRAQVMIGGRSVGVPGVVKLLWEVHQEYGVLPWRELFAAAIILAEEGFVVSPRLSQLASQVPFLSLQEDKIYKNPALATTLRTLATEGIEPFYHGDIAKEMVEAVQKQGGVLSLEDLASYQVKIRKPLVTQFDDYLIYGFPPPSSGGIATLQMLSILKKFDMTHFTLGSPHFIDLFCRASRMAFADRDYYVADPDFFPVPLQRLVDPFYLRKRAESVRKREKVTEGSYPGRSLLCCPPMIVSSELELPSTTQICVIDHLGNALSMTSSIENAFGSRVVSGGFFLNNQLTDFSLIPQRGDKKAANRIEPGKRPMSSMSPTLVFHKEKKQLILTLGSAGGARIIDYVAKALCGVLLFDLNIQEAISFPNFASISDAIDLEENTFLMQQVPELEELGNRIQILPLTSGSQGIQYLDGKLIGGADPRREGRALGQ